MATIFSKSGSFFNTMSWFDPNVWDGGIVPTASDDVFIRGVRTTLNYSGPQGIVGSIAGYTYFPGTSSYFFVANTGSFPYTGSLYAYTNRNEEIKLDYNGYSTGSGQGPFYFPPYYTPFFTNVNVDTNYNAWASSSYPAEEAWPSTKGGFIPNGSFITYRPGLIVVSGSQVAEFNKLTIEAGGKLDVKDSASLKIGNYIVVNDGHLKASGSIKVLWNRIYTGSAGQGTQDDNLHNFIRGNNFPHSTIEFIGPEVRLNTVLSTSASIGDTYLQVSSSIGFKTGDWIFVGEEDLPLRRTDNLGGVYSYANPPTQEDECFYVALNDTGSTPNRLYVQRMNGLQGKVLATASATEIIVDEERYNVGDKVIINGQVRTITEVTSSFDYLLKDYNFQSGSSDLSEWTTDSTYRGTIFEGWRVAPGIGLTPDQPLIGTNNLWKHIFVKDIFRDTVKIEAWLSNTNTVTRDTRLSEAQNINRRDFGLLLHSEPTVDDWWGWVNETYQNSAQPYKSFFSYDTNLNRTRCIPKNHYSFFNHGIDKIISTDKDGLHKFTFEYSRGFLKAYIDDNIAFDEMLKEKATAGRVGIYTYGNNYMVCTRFKVYAKGQKLTLDSSVTGVDTNTIVYETGVEIPHRSVCKVIKLASFVTDPLEHKNLAFAYRGAEEFDNNGLWPQVYAYNTNGTRNGSGGSSTWLLVQNTDTATYWDQGGPAQRSFTLDLQTPVTFSNFSVVDALTNYGQNYSSGVSVSGSLDGVTYYPLTGGIDLRPRFSYDSLRDYQLTSSVTYRFVRFDYTYTNVGTYRMVSAQVRNLKTGSNSNRIQVNNAYDFNIGDHINILSKGATNVGREMSQYYSRIQAGTGSDSGHFFDQVYDYYTVVSKSGDTITLDKYFNRGIVSKGDIVVKLNREFVISGSYTSGSWKSGKVNTSSGINYRKSYIFKNVAFRNNTDEFPYRQDGQYGAFSFRGQPFFNEYAITLQGCSLYDCQLGGFNFFSNQYGDSGRCYRHSVFHSLKNTYEMNPYNASYPWPWIMTGNIFYDQNNLGTISNHYNLFNQSYNIFAAVGGAFSSIGMNSPEFPGVTPNGGQVKHTRNLYRGTSYGVNFNTLSYFYQNGSTINLNLKNNKAEFTYNAPIFYYGMTDKPLEGFLLPDKSYSGTNRTFNLNSPTGQSVIATRGSSVAQGNVSSHVKNYNRYDYDVWANTRGYVIKFPTESEYRFYSYASEGNFRYPFLQANIQLTADITASFEVGFDYITGPGQWSQTERDFTQSLAPTSNYDQLVDSGSFAGCLVLTYSKDGTISNDSFTLIRKENNKTRFTKTYVISGSGIHTIGLGSSTYNGYTSFSGISSKLITPDKSNTILKNNSFDMKIFDDIGDLQAISKNVQTSQTQKFRLKGATLF